MNTPSFSLMLLMLSFSAIDGMQADTIDHDIKLSENTASTAIEAQPQITRSPSSYCVPAPLSLDDEDNTPKKNSSSRRQDSIRSEDTGTLRQRCGGNTQTFFNSLVQNGSMIQEEADLMCTQIDHEMGIILSGLEGIDRKKFIRDQITFLEKDNAQEIFLGARRRSQTYDEGTVEDIRALAESTQPLEHLEQLFTRFHVDVRTQPLTEYLVKRITLVSRLLKNGVSPTISIRPSFGNDTVLQDIFINHYFANTFFEVMNDQTSESLLQLIEMLIDAGLPITHKNTAGYDTLDFMERSQTHIENNLYSQTIAQSSCDRKGYESKLSIIRSVFKDIRIMMHNTLEKKQQEFRELHNTTALPTHLPSTLVDFICNYVGLFSRQPEIERLISETNRLQKELAEWEKEQAAHENAE